MDRIELRSKFSGRIEKFRLEEFDLEVYLRQLSALARAKLSDKFMAVQGDGQSTSAEAAVVEVQCRVVAEGLVDEHGSRIYKDDELQQIAEEIPGTALDQISKRIMTISGLGGGAAEALAKNSEPTPNANSPSV